SSSSASASASSSSDFFTSDCSPSTSSVYSWSFVSSCSSTTSSSVRGVPLRIQSATCTSYAAFKCFKYCVMCMLQYARWAFDNMSYRKELSGLPLSTQGLPSQTSSSRSISEATVASMVDRSGLLTEGWQPPQLKNCASRSFSSVTAPSTSPGSMTSSSS